MRALAKITGALAAVAALTALVGCSAPPAAEPSVPPEAGAPSATAPEKPAETMFSLDSISSCAQVEQAVAAYIEGLVPDEGNVVDEWGVTCQWESPEEGTDLADIRSVSVLLEPVEADTEAPDPSMVAEADGGSVIESDWVAGHGGVAFSLTLGTAVAGSTATTVWVPGVEAQVGGAQWGDYPALDGPAAVAVVQSLLS